MTAIPPPPQTLLTSTTLAAREQAVAQAESELVKHEAPLVAWADHLEAGATALATQVDALWRRVDGLARAASGRGPELQEQLQRLEALQPSPLSVLAQRERALAAREKAVRVRAEVAEESRRQVERLAAWMAAAKPQLEAEEAQVRKVVLARQAEEAQHAEQARRAEARKAQLRLVPRALAAVEQVEAPRPTGRLTPPRAARKTVQAEVDFESDTNFYTGFSDELDEGGGLFVATVNVLEPGAQVEVQLLMPNRVRVSTPGVVRWVREVNDAQPEIFPGMGVELVDLPEAVRGAIRRFTAVREPLFFARAA